jgi:carboxyl-terminal processing protease
MANDIITRLDNEQVRGLTLNQAVEKMRDPVNTKVKLTIMRKGLEKPVEVTIVRDVIRVNSARSHSDGNDIGYIRIMQFTGQTTDALKKGDQRSNQPARRRQHQGLCHRFAQQSGAPAGSSDLGLRRVPRLGRDRFTRGRNAEETQRFNARPGDQTKGKPLNILINGGSASAAKIVAGALQDHKRATLVGTRSFGKGSVQTIMPLGRGNGALRLTTARYFTPSGRSIQAKGIEPDIKVLQEVSGDLKGRTETEGEASLRGHLKAEGAEETGWQFVPTDERDDRALKEAFDLLRGTITDAAFPADLNSANTR